VHRDDKAGTIVCSAERVIAADPTQVWALVADPMRVGEWAPFEVVGYMGTELPKRGQIVFLRTRWWRPGSRERRVEVQEWEAGTMYRCEVQPDGGAAPIGIEVGVTPEVTGAEIATRIRLTQRLQSTGSSARVLRWYLTRQLERRLDRITKASGA
jgi:uncharacterized protein YndB with AHSA1/START domain